MSANITSASFEDPMVSPKKKLIARPREYGSRRFVQLQRW